MAGIKEIPTNFRMYYLSMKNAYTEKKKDALTNLDNLRVKLKDLYNIVFTDFNNNKKDYPINLDEYKEFVDNKYIDGKFLRVAKGLVINKEGNYELVGRNFDVYQLAKTQNDIRKEEDNIYFYNKLLNLTVNQYKDVLKIYYSTVQKKLIIDGFGYSFEGYMGWICINRCKNRNKGTRIDYQATKKRKKQLLEEGKRIYNKEEAEWCLKNGIEYDGVDGRVFQNMEYYYQIPLISCRLPNARDIEFIPSDYRGRTVRGKTNGMILEESGGDINKICDYDVDIRTKLNICIEADKMLYTKFIRNENQKACGIKSLNR